MLSKPVDLWKIDTKTGWRNRPDFVNDAIENDLIEIIKGSWVVHGVNATMFVKDGDYIICYEDGSIAAYSEVFVNAAKNILGIAHLIKE